MRRSNASRCLLAFAACLPSVAAQVLEHRVYHWTGPSRVCLVGDVDSDSYADVVTGDPSADANGIYSGRIDVRSGRHGGLLYSRPGDNSNALFGIVIVAIGDLDRDQRPDFAVADHHGRVYALSGRSGTPIHAWYESGVSLGSNVGSAGDTDGDGTPDVLITVVLQASPTVQGVRVYSGADGKILRTLVGGGAMTGFGTAMAAMGDIDRDGHDDFAISSPMGGTQGIGLVQVFSGRTGAVLYEIGSAQGPAPADDDSFGEALATPGDVDADGWLDLAIGHGNYGRFHGEVRVHSGRDGRFLYRVVGLAERDALGQAVSAAGDVDGDGRGDLVIGAFPYPRLGYALLTSGRDGRVLATFSDGHPSQAFGKEVSGGHDVNHDGVSDVVVAGLDFARVLSGRPLELTTDVAGVSLTSGGQQPLDLHAGGSSAHQPYWLVGSASGRDPGIWLGGLHLPLQPDGYLLLTLAYPNVWIHGSLGLLDASGRATATLDLPPGLAPELAGLTLDHAFVAFDPRSQAITRTSNATSLRLER